MSAGAEGGAAARFGWVDFAKGFCIISVVMQWVDKVLELDSGLFHEYVRFARPYRMPDFFLISGLFLSRVIDRPLRTYLDTKVVHYLYFYFIWSFVYVAASWLKDIPVSSLAAATEMGRAVYEPIGNLWFVAMLALYFVVVRLTVKVPFWVMLAAGVVLHLFYVNTGFFLIDLFGSHFIFFYVGYYFSSNIFTYADWVAKNWRSALVFLAAWAIGNWIITVSFRYRLDDALLYALVLRFMGIAAVVTVSSMLWHFRYSAWLVYLGRNSIVIYLGFYIPLQFALFAGPRFGFDLASTGFAFGVWVFCVVCAMIPFWLTRKTWLKYLYTRPPWAKIAAKPHPQPQAVVGI